MQDVALVPSFESVLFHFDLITLFFLSLAVCFYPSTERSFLCLGIVSKRFRGAQMFGDCQRTLVNQLSGSLVISTDDRSSCRRTRQWYFFYDYGYTLLIRFMNITQILSSTHMLRAYSMTDGHRTLLSDISNATSVDQEVLIQTEDDRSGLLVELTSVEGRQHASFTIDYVFRGKMHAEETR